jgi:propanol-preferring alcohol dehydrogenase
MRAMVLHTPGQPLQLEQRPIPTPGSGQLLIKVLACGVCRTDLHLVDGELPQAQLPRVPGHEIVGEVTAVGATVGADWIGRRVGVPWLGWTCGECAFCRSGRENLCDQALFTGCNLDGGYAEYTVADERFCLPIPDTLSDVQAAPLLCAGLIGFRALQMAADAAHLGLYGFGAAAHLAIQVALGRGQQVYAFTRPGDSAGQAYARSLGAVWAGPSDQLPPHLLDASLIFAPVGALVPLALAATVKGGCVILRRDSHERYSGLPLSTAMGRTQRAFSGEPDPTGRHGVLSNRAAHADPLRHHPLRPGRRQSGTRAPAQRAVQRRDRADPITRSSGYLRVALVSMWIALSLASSAVRWAWLASAIACSALR